MLQQQSYMHSQQSPQYGTNFMGAPQAPARQMDYFTSAGANQQMSIFNEYPVPPPVQMQGRSFGEMYNDEGSNIYTEPTLIDQNMLSHNRGDGRTGIGVASALGCISAPLHPPPPPPPIFTSSMMNGNTETQDIHSAFSIVSRHNNRQVDTRKSSDAFSFVDMITSQSCESVLQQTAQSQMTITGQDLEITFNNNGEMTQTVISNQEKADAIPGGVNSHDTGNLAASSTNPHLFYYYSNQRIEFLPLCDLLFNIISLAAYFCDVVFDSVTAYTLYLNNQILWLVVALMLIFTSAITSQLLSYKWYLRERRFREQMRNLHQRECSATCELAEDADAILTSPYEVRSPLALAATHICLCGVLLRYFKLFVPVNLSTVKREVRDLCVLRMVHGFCQAAPMLLLQVYLLWMKPVDMVTDLNVISICLSLFSLCWALSSFSKNIRQCQIHKLVLTWLGVIFQFFWRIGTVTSRIVALTIYATVYQQWIFVVLLLHWFSMFLWLSTPNINAAHDNIFEEDEGATQKQPTKRKRVLQNALIAWVYLFCFINMENTNPRYKMIIFYLIMFLENVLLLTISTFFGNHLLAPLYCTLAHSLVFGSFFFGIFFMFLYYRYFHIRHLKHTLDGIEVEAALNDIHRVNDASWKKQVGQGILLDGELFNYEGKQGAGQRQGNSHWKKESHMSRLVNALSNQIFPNCYHTPAELSKPLSRHHFNNDNIAGVFNCRLNPALKRKKKIPSTIPPPPIATTSNSAMSNCDAGIVHQQRAPLETIDEVMPTMYHQTMPSDSRGQQFLTGGAQHMMTDALTSVRASQYRRKMVHGQHQRPSTNTSILGRQMRQSGADTFWRKSALSARSLSISPSAMLKSAECSFRMPPKHPFSSTITTPTSPAHFLPTENFTDKLEVCMLQNESNNSRETRPAELMSTKSATIIRPKPITLDAVNDFLDYADPNRMMHEQSNGTLVHYYYNPQLGKMTLRSQTPEVLLQAHTNSSRIFYDYPSTVMSMQHPVEGEKMINGDDEDLIFTRQCQRPPVPGREGDDKSEELNDNNDNVSYVEGKRSLLNYGLSTSRLEKILEKKQEEANKSQFAYTLPNSELKGKGSKQHSRHASGQLKMKKKYTSKSKKNKSRSNMRAISQHSIHSSDSRSSSPSDGSHCSSGENGDIESDHDRGTYATRPSTMRQSIVELRPQNVYEHVLPAKESSDEEAMVKRTQPKLLTAVCASPTGITTAEVHSNFASTLDQQPRIIRGPAHQFTLASHATNTSFGGHKIANYHMASEQHLRQATSANQRSKRGTAKPLYNSAKYKRHNTPL